MSDTIRTIKQVNFISFIGKNDIYNKNIPVSQQLMTILDFAKKLPHDDQLLFAHALCDHSNTRADKSYDSVFEHAPELSKQFTQVFAAQKKCVASVLSADKAHSQDPLYVIPMAAAVLYYIHDENLKSAFAHRVNLALDRYAPSSPSLD